MDIYHAAVSRQGKRPKETDAVGGWEKLGQTASPVGIVVVHHGDPAPTLRCVRSIEEDSSPVERSVVVVDNSPGHSEGLDLGGLSPRMQYLPCLENPGFGAGANRGIEALERLGEFDSYLIFNHDIEILSGYLEAANRALEERDVGAASGPLLSRPASGRPPVRRRRVPVPDRHGLAVLHTPHEAYRALRILLLEGRKGLPKVRAILRGQRTALRDLFRRR